MELQSIKQRFGIIGNSKALNNALQVAVQVAPTNLSVLITGESGVGKEVFSQIIHYLSPRKHEGFIAVNCGAIPEGTIDSELFGHEKGAFTGAQGVRKGYFETVNGGTIFLDEIGEMPIGTQARLLRVLESGEFIKVGSSTVQKTDVRVLAATNVDLPKLVAQGKFREDLYYRLNTVPIYVAPLRERKEDIYLLFRKFTSDFSDKYRTSPIVLEEEAQQLLINYRWPGNIRQLKNIAEKISVLSPQRIVSKEILAEHLPNLQQTTLPALAKSAEKESMTERELLYKMLFDIKGDVNDLKQFIWKMAQGEKIELGNSQLFADLLDSNASNSASARTITGTSDVKEEIYGSWQGQNDAVDRPNQTIIIEDDGKYAEENIEESLSLSDMEKELIKKALEKHRGKRKNAAFDLGISERTLYRKIKEYDISA